MKGWEKISHANGNDTKAEVAILIVDKTDFKTKSITKDKEENFKMMKKLAQEKDNIFASIHEPNTGALNFVRQILIDIKRKISN